MQDAFGVERVSKGEYSDVITSVQRDRQKANRRRSAGNAALGAAGIAGGTALASPNLARFTGQKTGEKLSQVGNKAIWNSATNEGRLGRAKLKAGTVMVDVGRRIHANPRAAVAGTIVGAAAAGLGLRAAGAAHNARSNANARAYNRKNKNSKIKVVPVSGKNRF